MVNISTILPSMKAFKSEVWTLEHNPPAPHSHPPVYRLLALAISRGRSELQLARQNKQTILSPETTKVWRKSKPKAEQRVAVVYYLCRNGNLEHPHFMEVPLASSSNEGLYLRDVINRLNILRGNGIGNMYSWSSKQSYKMMHISKMMDGIGPDLAQAGLSRKVYRLMALAISRGRSEHQIASKEKQTILSPERIKVWRESKPKAERRVPVVYYLCRNGNLEHPHFMEVPLASNSNEGLYLRDVINRLNILRRNGIGNMYSWSSKRSYKNGYVWQDLSEDDFIHPVHGQEYVLKGLEILQHSVSFRLNETKTEMNKTEGKRARRINQSLSSIDLNECKVYKAELSSDSAEKDASTQTEGQIQERKIVNVDNEVQEKTPLVNQSTELNREENSPSPTNPDSAESGLNLSERLDGSKNNSGGKSKTSTVLIQLISCGALTTNVEELNSGHMKNQRFSLIPQLKATLPRVASSISREVECLIERFPSFGGRKLEEKKYFSGSLLIEKAKKKDEFHPDALKRSCSCNVDR